MNTPSIAPGDQHQPLSEYLSAREAAALLGISLKTLGRWEKQGLVSSARPDGKERRFSRADILAFKARQPLTIAEAADYLGSSVSTLRRLEQRGQLTPQRNGRGDRQYTREQLEAYRTGSPVLATVIAPDPAPRIYLNNGSIKNKATVHQQLTSLAKDPTVTLPTPPLLPLPPTTAAPSRWPLGFLIGAPLISLSLPGPLGYFGAFLLFLSGCLLLFLRRFFVKGRAGTAIHELIAPSVGTAFAQGAPAGKGGEVLLPYRTYKSLRHRILTAAATIVILLFAAHIGLKILPVPTYYLLAPVIALCTLSALTALRSLVTLVPAGQRWQTLKATFFVDPRHLFARYAPTTSDGAVTVGYTTYKRLAWATRATVSTLVVLVVAGLAYETYWAKQVAYDNFAATREQFNRVAASLTTGQSSLQEELKKLAAQSLQSAPTVNEDSLTQRILDQVTANLPDAPIQIVRETSETKVVERTVVEQGELSVIQIEDGGTFAIKNDQGTTFMKFDSDQTVTLEESGVFNIDGTWQIDGTKVTATASELNTVASLDDASYLVLSNTSTLTSERALTASSGLSLTDGGGNNTAILAIATDGVTEAMLKVVDTATDEECFTYETTTGDFEWQTCGSGMTSFTLAGDTGSSQTISDANTLTIATGAGLTATAGATDTVTLGVDDDGLDFAHFEDTLDLDANLTLNQGTNSWSQNFTGTTAHGLTYTAASLTTGRAFTVAATNTAASSALSQVLFSLTNAQTSGASSNFNGFEVAFSNNPTVAGNTEHIATLRNSITSNTTDTAVSAILRLDNEDSSTSGSTVVTDALKITSSGDIAGGITNAINIDDTDVTNDLVLQNDEVIHNNSNGTIAFTDGTNVLMTILDQGTTGSVGIGATASATNTLTVTQNGTSGQAVAVAIGNASNDSTALNVNNQGAGWAARFFNYSDNTTNVVKIDSDGTGDLLLLEANGTSTTANGLLIDLSSSGTITDGIQIGTGTRTITNALAIRSTGVTSDIVLQNNEVIHNDTDGTVAITDGTNALLSVVDAGTLGNVGIGTSTFGSSAAGVLAIAGSTAPGSSITNGVQLWAEDVAGSHELRVRDEAGNVTTLSPHNFSLFEPNEDYLLPWSFYSKNDTQDKEINVDMYGAIEAVELLTGNQYIYAKTLSSGEEFKAKHLAEPGLLYELQDRLTALEGKVAGITTKASAEPLQYDLETELTKLLTKQPKLFAQLLSKDTVPLTQLTLSGTLVVQGKATFLGDVEVEGVLTLDGKQGGKATIPARGRSVRVTYPKAFAQSPQVVVTPRGIPSSLWGITDESENGFTLTVAKPLDQTVTFSWLAIPVRNPGKVMGEAEEEEASDENEAHEDRESEESSDPGTDAVLESTPGDENSDSTKEEATVEAPQIDAVVVDEVDIVSTALASEAKGASSAVQP